MLNLYSIYDNKADKFQGVLCFPDDINAKRYCYMLVNNPDSLESNFKGDYSLYRVGSFDPSNGRLIDLTIKDDNTGCVSLSKPQLVVNFVDIPTKE